MKKISFFMVVLLLVFVFTNQVFGEVVTTRKLRKPQKHSQEVSGHSRMSGGISKRRASSKASLEQNLKNCIPYSENQVFDVGGVNFQFNVEIVEAILSILDFK